jgi:hypothetical protein
MLSESVHASQLLASYLEKEHDKIGQGIIKSDFAGELQKHFPAQTPSTGTIPSTLSANASDVAGGNNSSAAASPTTAPSNAKVSGKQNDADPGTKIQTLKTKAKNQDRLYVADPAKVEAILAQFQYPAETIKACQTIQNKDGMISLGDLKNLLNKQGPVQSAMPGAISPEQAQALIGAILAKNSDTGQNAAQFGNANLLQSIQMKTDAPYTVDEFKALIDKILQQTKTNDATVVSKAANVNTTQIVGQTPVTAKTGQSESLTASIIPSFFSNEADNYKNTAIKKSLGADNEEPVPPSGNVMLQKDRETQAKVPEALVAKAQANQNEPVSSGYTAVDNGDIPQLQQTNAAQPDASDKPVASVAPSVDSASQKTKDVPQQTLDSLLQDFDAKVVSSGPTQADVKTGNTPLPTGTQDIAVSQTQNLAVPAKEAEKQSDKLATPNSPLLQDAPEIAAGNQVKTDPIQNSSGDLTGDSNSNQATGLPQKDSNQTASNQIDQRPASANFHEEVKTQTSKMASAAQNQPQGMVAAGTAVPGQTHPAADTGRTDLNPNSDPASVQSTPVSSLSKTAAATQEILQKFGFSTDGVNPQTDASAQDQSGKTTSLLQESIGLKVDGLKTTQEHITIQAHDVALAAKEIEKQLKNPDSVPEAAVLQNTAARTDGNQIVFTNMDSTAQNGFAYYDPYHSVELAQTYREQASGTSGHQLVLEMEPDSLGKVSIKVGARKEEISATILTENESARQALLKNTPELRQNLESQGLNLGKFMVDVGQNKAGGDTSRQWQEPRSMNTPTSPAQIKVVPSQTQATPAYVRTGNARSQISIFA